MRKSLKLVALAGVAVASLLLAPTAHATGGDEAPTPPVPGTPKAACAVVGTVTAPHTEPPMTIGHSNYTFVTTTITCVYTDGRVVAYNVTASGDSWGPLHAGNCSPSSAPPGSGPGLCAGSSTLVSWSDNSAGTYSNPCGTGSAANMGAISATDASGTANGYVKFLRVASETVAWGEFCTGSGSGVGDSFFANLEFTPQNPTADYMPGDPVPYDLRGVATIND